MNIDPKKSFFRDIKKINSPLLKEEIERIIEAVIAAQNINYIPRLRKLKGYQIHYRIRVGNCRIGVSIENDLVTFERFAHRKDFYKIFP